MERKLASVQLIAEVRDIPNADNLQHYRINGWWVVDRKDQYQISDKVIYLEIDSWVPTELAPFLSKGKEPREFNGIKGERLRTIKLRGAVSQGLIIRASSLFAELPDNTPLEEGTDVTEVLGIQKWEKPIPTQLAGQMKGNFPAFLRKTDQERIQNIPSRDLETWALSHTFQISEKLDGSSMSCYFYNDAWGVTSRNIDLKLDQEANSFVDTFRTYESRLNQLAEHLAFVGVPDFAVQGELVGGNIQGNQYNVNPLRYFIYDIYDITTQSYLPPGAVFSLTQQFNLDHVPVIQHTTNLVPDTTTLLSSAEGISHLNDSIREGLVFKSDNREVSFKVINNSWLIKYD